MLRSALLVIFILGALIAPRAAHAYGETAHWADPKLGPRLKDILATPGTWKRVNPSLASLTPAVTPPLELKAGCSSKAPSAFYSELEGRGALFTQTNECQRIILWYTQGSTVNYTFKEVQSTFLPIEGIEEAAAFLLASGMAANIPWYGTIVDNVIYIMSDQTYCGGLGHRRIIFRIDAQGMRHFTGTVTEPPPNGVGCSFGVQGVR